MKIMNQKDNCFYESEFLKTAYFDCVCDHNTHILRFIREIDFTDTVDDEELYVEIQLAPGNIWHKIKTTFKYWFTKDAVVWGGWTLKRKDAERLQKLVTDYINSDRVRIKR